MNQSTAKVVERMDEVQSSLCTQLDGLGALMLSSAERHAKRQGLLLALGIGSVVAGLAAVSVWVLLC
jgi:hypothetical protein